MRGGKDDIYLPAITTKASSLNSIRGALSQSCPYLYDKRRGSFSSVASQRTGGHLKKQVIWHLFKFQSKWFKTCFKIHTFRPFFHLHLFSYQSSLKVQREAKKSNVTVTMTYLGQGHRGSGLVSAQDELKVLQQVNGGENICVFKGLVTPGGRSCEMWSCFARMDKNVHKRAFKTQFWQLCL